MSTDNIIMKKLEKFGILKFKIAWRKIPNYESYYQYQIAVRNAFENRITMEVEFELFNLKSKILCSYAS